MSSRAKNPATISMAELTEIATEASRRAGQEARDAGIKVAAIDVPEATSPKKAAARKPAKLRV